MDNKDRLILALAALLRAERETRGALMEALEEDSISREALLACRYFLLGRQVLPPKITQMSVLRRVGLPVPHEALEPQPGFFLR